MMDLSKCHLLHNMHFVQKDIHWLNREETRRPFSRTPFEKSKEMTGTHPNQSPDTLISLNILANTSRSAAYPYIRLTWKAVKI